MLNKTGIVHHTNFLPGSKMFILIMAGFLACRISAPSHLYRQWHRMLKLFEYWRKYLSYDYLLTTYSCDLQLRVQLPIVTGFPFNTGSGATDIHQNRRQIYSICSTKTIIRKLIRNRTNKSHLTRLTLLLHRL
jgi:hypothetical protein